MKRILLLLFILSSTLKAQIFLDTLVCRTVGPGTVYTKIKAPAVPWDIDVLRIDLKNPYIKVETVKAYDRYAGREQTSSMAKRKSCEGHYVLGAVNGDFYDLSNGKPINVQVENGEIIRIPVSLSAIGFGPENKPMLAITGFKGKVIAKNGTVNIIQNINETRSTNQLILYNSFMGDTTGTNAFGVEALVRPLKSWMVNDTIRCVVEKIENSIGKMKIIPGKAVLSGHGTSGAFISGNISVGDTIKVYQEIKPGLAKIKEMIGGYPKIVYQGMNFAEQGFQQEGGPDHAHNLEPRTGAGFSADSSYLYLVTLDGRGASVGATLPELADVMIRLGVAYGINFDGGGSTTMVVRGNVMNIPSDGTERADANCLMVASTAPSSTDSLKSVAISVKNKRVYKGEKTQFTLLGNDRYGNPVNLNSALVQFSVSPSIGTIDKTGMLTAAGKAAKGFIYAKYNDLLDSAFVVVKSAARLSLNPESTVIDAIKPLKLAMRGWDIDNLEKTVFPDEAVWKSTNPSVVQVDSSGTIYGKSEGNAKIIAALENGVSDTVNITVQIGKGVSVLNQMEDISTWKVSGFNIDLDSTKLTVSNDNKTQGSGALKIDYRFTYFTSLLNYIYLDTEIPIYSIPDSLFIDTRSDSTQHRLSFILSDDNGELFRVYAKGFINSADKFNTLPVQMQNFAPIGGGKFYYPARITRLEIQLQYNNTKRVSGQRYSGTIYLDNLRAKYPAGSTLVEEESKLPKAFYLKQNYPNPFNPSTVIEFSSIGEDNITLKVYDMLGREVAVLVNGRLSEGIHKAVWNAGSSASGIYFCRLQSGNFIETKKMLLLR